MTTYAQRFPWPARLQFSRGKYLPNRPHHIFGHNDAVGAAWEALWLPGNGITWLQAGDTVRIAAGGDADDTAAGTGAQIVTLTGLLASTLKENTELLATAGVSASGNSASNYIRINELYIPDEDGVGAYNGSNAGLITLESTGGTTLRTIGAGKSVSHDSVFSVPKDFKAYISQIVFQPSSTQSMDFRIMARAKLNDVTPPCAPVKVVHEVLGLDRAYVFHHDEMEEFDELTDIWMEGQANTGSSKATGEIEIYLIDQSSRRAA